MVSSLVSHREREKLVRLGGSRHREREYYGGGDGRGRKHESDERSARGGDAGTSDRGSEIGDASDRKWSRYHGVSSRDSSRNCGRNSSRYEAGVREYIRNPTGTEKDRGHFRNWESSAESTPGRERERENARLRKRDTETDSYRSRQQLCWGLVNGESGGGRLPSPLFSRPSLVTSSTGGLSSSQLLANGQESSGEQFEVNARETSDSEAGRRSGVIVSDKKGNDVYREPGEEGNLSSDLATPQRARSSSRSLKLHSSEPGGRSSRSPPKKRKFSPIVWDCDEKQSRRSKVTSVSSSSSGSLSMSGISSVETVTVSSLQQQSVAGRLAPASTHANNYVSPPQPLSSARIRTPYVSVGSQLERTISSTSAQSKSFPLLGQTKNSLTTNEERECPDAHMLDQVMPSPMSDDWPQVGQVLSEQECPKDEEEEEDGCCRPVFVTVAASRWAKDSVTSENKISSRLRVVGNGRGRPLSRTPKKNEPRTSAEPFGSRGAEKVNDIDGSVGQGSGSEDRRSDSFEDGEYKREWMDLGVENLDHEEEEQVPKVGTEYEVLLSPPVSQLRAIDMLQGCRSVDEFERLNTIDEGTYGVVYQARNKKTGEVVALKKVKMENQQEGFPITSLREINILLSIHHPSIVDVKEVVVGKTIDSIYMVMEYMEHDLKGLMEALKQPFCQSEVKCLMLQLFEGTKYLHDNWVLHRDFKTSNLLLNNKGELKICDFGLARQYGSPSKAYSHMVVTLWYRAPELLLGSRQYSAPIDMWSLGCIMAEFLGKEPLFNGKSEIDQIDKIFKILGTPSEETWPDFVNLPGAKCNFVRQPVHSRLREKFPATSFSGRPALSESGYNLLNGLLTYDPKKRLTAEEALNHEWFREVPLPKSKQFMPTFPARSQHDRRFRRLRKHSDPLEEQRKRELRQGEVGARGFFG